ncbi:hypothetical protein VZT92_014137 [Zoarces viviparus]|uniref:Uncharacterized protein n=1 Tax=Zoarces viviparus TaxID=48416 RepID=A0AAW1F1R4_ZOAVI
MHTFSRTQDLSQAGHRFTHSARDEPGPVPPKPPARKEEDPPLWLLCQSRGRMSPAGSVRFPVIDRETIQSPAD